MMQTTNDTLLNPNYTFDNFVTGDSNALAYAVSVATAEAPGEVYNPLFIYGDVGLGKTHLMNAIGNYIIQQNPLAKIYLTTSERFTSELINSIAKRQGSFDIRSKMRNVDVLMVDDIQFLGKTNVSQEEFFHTFNELHNAGKQIVICSDRPPNEMPTIEERLRSRFGSGLIVDIRKPDFETRVAILKRKAAEEEVDIPYDVMEYIAAHFDRSIRELEGALTRVVAKSKLEGYPISMDLAMTALGGLEQTQDTRVITPKIVMEVISKKTGVTVEDICSKKRNKEITEPRQIAIYICRELTDLSTTNLGKEFGGRDHTTVMHSCEKIAERMKLEPFFRKRIEDLIASVKAN
jgi:chromosomal replication initiator protein